MCSKGLYKRLAISDDITNQKKRHAITTLNMIFGVTISNCLCSILIVNCGIALPTLNVNPTLFVIPCKK